MPTLEASTPGAIPAAATAAAAAAAASGTSSVAAAAAAALLDARRCQSRRLPVRCMQARSGSLCGASEE